MSAPPADPARLTDDELVGRVADRDAGAFAELYDRHVDAAFSLARRMLDPSHAEEAVAGAFAVLRRNARAYDAARGPVLRWLLGLVRDQGLRHVRGLDADQRRRLRSTPAPRRSSTAGPDVLAALPPDERAVVELTYYAGLTQSEVARQLDLPVDAVRERTRRALRKLRAGPDPSAYASAG